MFPLTSILLASALLVLGFCSSHLLLASEPDSLPAPVTLSDHDSPEMAAPHDIATRKRSVEREIDRNVEAVKQLFDLIDHTPEADAASREFYDQQIEQFDQRSEILHDELNQLLEDQRWQDKQSELRARANRWLEQAKQLRKQGHFVPASLFKLKAESILRSFGDGTWRLLVESGEKTAQPSPSLTEVLKLNLEITELQDDTQKLRVEVSQLRNTIDSLEATVAKLLAGEVQPDAWNKGAKTFSIMKAPAK